MARLMDKHYRTGWHRPARAEAESPPPSAPGPGNPPDSVPVSRSEPQRPDGAARFPAEPPTWLESDCPSLAEYEGLYADTCHAAAPLIRICEQLGRKIGKLRSSVRRDLDQLVLDVRSDRRR